LGGKNPHWNDRLFFTVPFGTDPMMKVEVMDKDVIDDDIIGYGVYNVAQYMSQRMNTTGNPPFTQSQLTSSTITDTLEESPLPYNSREE
jgi:hypothetical protein